MITAILLDFDDTLALTREQSFKIQNETLLKMGRKEIDPEVHKKTWGMVLTESMPLRSPGVDYEEFKKLYDETRAEYLAKGEVDIVTEENLEIIEALIKQERYVGIVTSRSENEVKHLLEEKHSLSKLIKEIYHKDNTEFQKPNPKVFDPFFAKEGLKPEECVYVGDSIGDAEASLTAGMKFIACLESGLKNKNDFAGLKVDCFIDKFTELLEVVRYLDQNAT